MLLAVNVTAAVPATPSNVGVFQAACVAVLTGAYGVSTADALGYGIVLQAVEIATAVVMGMPALLNEGLSWREVRLRAMQLDARPAEAAPGARRAVAARAASSHAGVRTRARPARRKAPAVADAFVYVLRCADGSLYTGWTVDLDRRLAAHAAGTGEPLHAQPAARSRSRRPGRWPTARPRAARRRGSSALTARGEAQPARGRSAYDAAAGDHDDGRRAASGAEIFAVRSRRAPTSAR